MGLTVVLRPLGWVTTGVARRFRTNPSLTVTPLCNCCAQGVHVKGLLAVASAHKAATVVVVSAVLGVGSVVNAATDSSTTATVAKVVDGDTIDVQYDGETH